MLRLALRHSDGRKQIHTITSPVRPNFYLAESDLKTFINDIQDKCSFPGYGLDDTWKFAHPDFRHETPVKVKIWNPYNVRAIKQVIYQKKRFMDKKIIVGEADFDYIWVVLRELGLNKAVDIVDGKLVASDELPDPLVLFVDIETEGFSANHSQITCIQTITMDGKLKIFHWHPTIAGTSEKIMMIEFLNYVQHFDHLIGWNIDFDKKFLIDRTEILGFKFDWIYFKWLDLEQLYRKDGRFPWRVSLEFAVKKDKFKEKFGYEIKKIKDYEKLRREDYPQYLERVTKHVVALRDLERTRLMYSSRLKLADRSNVWIDQSLYASTNIRSILWSDPYSGGTKWIFGCKNYDVGGGSGNFKAALVLEPKRNFQTNVALIDFLSLYNKVIQTWNIGFDTLDVNGAIRATNNNYTDEFRALPARKLEWIEKLREENKALRKKAAQAGDEVLYEAYDAAQRGDKTILLTMYGATGDPRSDIYIPPLAEDIALGSRGCFETTIEETALLGYETEYGDTDSLINKVSQTTDNFEETFEKASALVEHLNGYYHDVYLPQFNIPVKWRKIEMKLEEIMMSVLFTAKKRYAYLKVWDLDHGWLDEPILKVKGMETQRNEWCELSKVMLEKVLNMRLYQKDSKEVMDYVNETKSRLYAGELDPLLILSTGLGRPIHEYASPGPHVKAAKMMEEMGYTVRVRDKIDYIITGHSKKGQQVLPVINDEIPEITQKAYDYYWTNKIFPPIQRTIEGSMPAWQYELMKQTRKRKELSSFFN